LKREKHKVVERIIKESIKLKEDILSERNIKKILLVSETIVETLKKNKKILLCGNGGSAADCQHWAGEMVGRFRRERKPYKFISLTTNTSILSSISNDYEFSQVFKRQVEGLGDKDDILICISTSGKSENIIEAAKKAKEKKMKTISLTGKTPNPLSKISDITLSVPSNETPRIQEIHILLIHIISQIVEESLCK